MKALVLMALAACGGTPAPKPVAEAPKPVAEVHAPAIVADPPPKHLLSIDWSTTRVTSEDEALALWDRIAPTGDDWEPRLAEIPTDKPIARALAVALLRGGNFRCPAVVTTHNCKRHLFDLEQPKPTDGLASPCLRRLLALWSIDQLEADDRAKVRDAMLDLVQLPPPESQLVSAVFQTLNEGDHDEQMIFYEAAWKAGQRDLVNGTIGNLDEPHLIEAVTRMHVDGALEILTATTHRATYLAAVADEQLATKTRTMAIVELAASEEREADPKGAKLSFDLKSALIAATSSPNCAVAAQAVRALEEKGQKQYLPSRPKVRTDKAMMRGLCVLASYEALQHADESSLLISYVPARGLQRVTVTYDPLAEVDTDGDGDPHTQHETILVPRAEVVVPDVEDLARAMTACTGTTCTSDDREYRFTFKGGELTRLEIAERPPCMDTPEIPKP